MFPQINKINVSIRERKILILQIHSHFWKLCQQMRNYFSFACVASKCEWECKREFSLSHRDVDFFISGNKQSPTHSHVQAEHVQADHVNEKVIVASQINKINVSIRERKILIGKRIRILKLSQQMKNSFLICLRSFRMRMRMQKRIFPFP